MFVYYANQFPSIFVSLFYMFLISTSTVDLSEGYSSKEDSSEDETHSKSAEEELLASGKFIFFYQWADDNKSILYIFHSESSKLFF